MLNILRNNTKIIIWLIVGSFCLWGTGSLIVGGTSGGNKAGYVFGKKVSYQEFNRYMKLVQIFGGKQMQELDEEVIEEKAWQQIALAMKAKQEGIVVSDEEVSHEIVNQISTPETFSNAQYQLWIKNVFKESPRVFEEKIRDIISIEKLISQQDYTPKTISDDALQERYLKSKPETTSEEFEKLKGGYRLATEEILMLEEKAKFIEDVVREAQIRSIIDEERKAKEFKESHINMAKAGSPTPLYVPVPEKE